MLERRTKSKTDRPPVVLGLLAHEMQKLLFVCVFWPLWCLFFSFFPSTIHHIYTDMHMCLDVARPFVGRAPRASEPGAPRPSQARSTPFHGICCQWPGHACIT
jgi:hypothetical protein